MASAAACSSSSDQPAASREAGSRPIAINRSSRVSAGEAALPFAAVFARTDLRFPGSGMALRTISASRVWTSVRSAGSGSTRALSPLLSFSRPMLAAGQNFDQLGFANGPGFRPLSIAFDTGFENGAIVDKRRALFAEGQLHTATQSNGYPALSSSVRVS